MKPRWYHQAETTLRKDIYDALVDLRHDVENQGSSPKLVLSGMSTYRQRQLTEVQTTQVQEWEFGYKVVPLDYREGFFRRTLYVKLHGGLIAETNKGERSQIIQAIAAAILDEGTDTDFESVNPSTFAIHQNFAVMFWHEGNKNIVTPSKELILGSNNIPKIGRADS